VSLAWHVRLESDEHIRDSQCVVSQFVGDWLKDYNDDKTLKATSKEIRDDISSFVSKETAQSSRKVVGIIEKESQQQSNSLSKTSDLIAGVAERAGQILKQVDRSLRPLGSPSVYISMELDCSSANYESLCDEAPKAAQKMYKRYPDARTAGGISLEWSDFPHRNDIVIPLSGTIIKNTRDVEKFFTEGCLSCDRSGDIRLDISPDNYSKIKSLDIMFYQSRNNIELSSEKTITPELKTKELISFSDLAGATIILSEENRALDVLTPTYLVLRTSSGQPTSILSFTARTLRDQRRPPQYARRRRSSR
jgi:hypothetical protein